MSESTALATTAPFHPGQVISFAVNTDAIEKLREEFGNLKINGIEDKAGYDRVHKARMTCVKHRTTVENQRKEFKEPALEYGKAVDKAAKQIVGEIEEIEAHLLSEENAYKAEQVRIKREAEEAKQRAMQQRLDKLAAVGATMNPMLIAGLDEEAFTEILVEKERLFRMKQEEEARAAAERDRLEAEEAERKRVEAERLAEERRELDEQRRKFEAEQAEFQAERKRLADQREAEQRAERLEQEKREAAERVRIETEERLKREREEAERKAEEERAWKAHQESLKPDREKLMAVVTALYEVDVPDCSTAEGMKCASGLRALLADCANRVRDAISYHFDQR